MYHQLPRLRLQGGLDHHPLMFGTGTQDQAAVEIVGILMEILMVVRILVEVEMVT